jgi:hypothetical protein
MRLREFCGSQSCFVVLFHALGSICNGDSVALKGQCRGDSCVHETPNDLAYCSRSHLPTSSVRCRDRRAVRALVHHLPIELSGSPGGDRRSRHCRVALDDSSLGKSLCAGVQETMEALRTAIQLTLSSCRQARQDGGFSASTGAQPLPWPASNSPIGYARDNSRSGAVDIRTSGH